MMMSSSEHSYEKNARGHVHENDGHLEVSDGKMYDIGVIREFGVDDDDNGTGIIESQWSQRQYAFTCDATLTVGIYIAEDTQLYRFEAIFNKEAEIWYARDVEFYNETDSDDDGADENYSDDDAVDEDAVAGTVTRYFAHRGYGFIKSDDSGATPSASEYFFHISQVEDGEIAEGDWVYFYEEYNEEKEGYTAIDIVLANDEKT